MSKCSVSKNSFTELLNKFQNMLLEFEAYVTEYDNGLPILKDTSAIHAMIFSFKRKLPHLLEMYEEEEDSCESLN